MAGGLGRTQRPSRCARAAASYPADRECHGDTRTRPVVVAVISAGHITGILSGAAARPACADPRRCRPATLKPERARSDAAWRNEDAEATRAKPDAGAACGASLHSERGHPLVVGLRHRRGHGQGDHGAVKLTRRIGRRGASLLFFSLLDLVYGFSLIVPERATRLNPLFVYLTRVMPLAAWGAAWSAVGVVLLLSAFSADDRAGFGVAAFWKVLWGLLTLASGIPRAYVSAVIWVALAGFILVLSGWPEPPRTRKDEGG